MSKLVDGTVRWQPCEEWRVDGGVHRDDGGHSNVFDYPGSMCNKPVLAVSWKGAIGSIVLTFLTMLVGCGRVPVKTERQPAPVKVWPLTT
ncbi:MAG TPA: hypothetical protein ACQGQX_08105, partial [Xylella taiwanensis]